ncbi:hypothetical protein [Lysobacter sp. HA18]
MTRSPSSDHASPASNAGDDERTSNEKDRGERLHDAADRDVESGRNSGRASDDTRQSP